jgi:hypothetical protein
MGLIVLSLLVASCRYGVASHSECGPTQSYTEHQSPECSEGCTTTGHNPLSSNNTNKQPNYSDQCDFARHHLPTW